MKGPGYATIISLGPFLRSSIHLIKDTCHESGSQAVRQLSY